MTKLSEWNIYYEDLKHAKIYFKMLELLEEAGIDDMIQIYSKINKSIIDYSVNMDRSIHLLNEYYKTQKPCISTINFQKEEFLRNIEFIEAIRSYFVEFILEYDFKDLSHLNIDKLISIKEYDDYYDNIIRELAESIQKNIDLFNNTYNQNVQLVD